ncbi:Eco57I restriction-modification methylase domain-containing protein [Bernardetia sp. OM2101]|uniref:type IIG restriction enzyme/methyltransferase n=1 Tax=Bernardetia sp. OM2101 TaxID=3344876 RepID=UPI0035CF898E
MKFEKQTPAQSLNQAYRKEHVEIKEFEAFRIALEKLLDEMEKQREENTKVLMSDFLKDAYYKNLHAINPAVDVDTVIHHQDTQKSPVGVMIENKKPNSSEFVSSENLNKKSFQQLIFYYLKERIENKNTEVKRLIITDVYQWFVFDETQFDKVFYQNKGLVKKYNDTKRDKKSTKHFYEEIAQHFIANSEQEITYTHFDLRDYQKELENFKINLDKKGKEQDETDQKAQKEEKKLIHLYKILSPVHLLKKPFANDSNSLNKDFYNELLHILGLEEVKEQNKKVIKRKNEKQREMGSFLENALSKLERKRPERIDNYKSYGDNDTERLENIALELCITWTNRILFLKLLEAQLLQYHKTEKKEIRQKYKFLNSQTIKDFVTLDDLFFGVLAKRPKDRREFLKDFSHIPYLNSSLFEETLLENDVVNASNLSDDAELTLYFKTILKDGNGVRRTGKETPLSYLFQFLDAYNFSSEGTEEIRKDKKTLINASVLGLIFEKINGYKDGSFYTPSFITMYMCRQTLRRSVVQKFSEEYKMEFESFEDLQEFLQPQYKSTDKLKNNKIFDSLKICDPAVGSGHFLVSALNELITIKSELGILADENGKGLPVEMRIENDELFAFETETDFFEYQIGNKQSQTIQKTLFHEKQKLIENCLFGVDINPNSVKICRLRLWIELLKNAYYTGESNFEELETLPNIDINIKTGNSLISRFDLDADISKALKKSKWTIDSYRVAVQTYRNATSKEQKYEMEKLIETIKTDFRSEVSKKDPKVLALSKKTAELQTLLTQTSVFELSKTEQKAKDKKIDKLQKEVLKLNTEIEDIKSNKIYQNAFEWRFEFPEVLDKNGNFIGFDVVIGNPPYGNIFSKSEKEWIKTAYNYSDYQLDIYMTFCERCNQIISQKGSFSFIVPNTWLFSLKTPNIRKLLYSELKLSNIRAFQKPVFEEAVVDTAIIYGSKSNIESDVIEVEIIGEEEEIIFNSFDRNSLSDNYSNPLNIYASKKALHIAKKISVHSNLDEVANITLGTKPFQKGKGKPKQTASIVKNKPFVKTSQIDNTFVPLLRGSLINRYITLWKENYYISFGDWLAEPRYSANYDAEKKIVIRQTGSSLIATLDYNQFIVRNNLYTIISKNDNYSEEFLLGLINSTFSNWFYQNIINNEVGEALAEVKRGHLSNIPIPKNPDSKNETQIEEKVTQILSLKKVNPSADTSALESEIDVLVYGLYGLSEEEIAIIEEQ